MLLEKKDVLEILRCPKSGNRLKRINNKLIAKNIEEHTEYEIIENYPVLIDFDRSILKKESFETLGSVVKRYSYSGLSGIIKRLVLPPKNVTVENVKYMMDLVSKSKMSVQVLVVGGGTIGQGMEPFYNEPHIDLVSFDIYASPTVQFLADAHNIPLPGDRFDIVIIQAVLEHVLEPIVVVSEIYRVLKQNGVVYAETPFLQHVHEGAYDFTRFTENGHRYLFKNFKLIKSGVTSGAGTQLLWSLDIFFRGLFRSKKLGKVLKLCFFWLQYFDRIIPGSYNIDAAGGVFFLGKKQLSQIDGKEMVAHYKGAQM